MFTDEGEYSLEKKITVRKEKRIIAILIQCNVEIAEEPLQRNISNGNL